MADATHLGTRLIALLLAPAPLLIAGCWSGNWWRPTLFALMPAGLACSLVWLRLARSPWRKAGIGVLAAWYALFVALTLSAVVFHP